MLTLEFLLTHPYRCISTYGFISDSKNNLLVLFEMLGMSIELTVPFNTHDLSANTSNMLDALADIFDKAISTSHIIRINSAPLFDIEVNCEVQLQCSVYTFISCDILEISDNTHIYAPAIIITREFHMSLFKTFIFGEGVIIEARELYLDYLSDVKKIYDVFPYTRFICVGRSNYMQNYIMPLLSNDISVCIGLVYPRLYICDKHLIYVHKEPAHVSNCPLCIVDGHKNKNVISCKLIINNFVKSLREIEVKIPKNANK